MKPGRHPIASSAEHDELFADFMRDTVMIEKYLPTTPEGRLWRLAEECGEVIQACSKVARFGLDGDDQAPVIGSTPRERLLAELVDLEHALRQVRGDLGR